MRPATCIAAAALLGCATPPAEIESSSDASTATADGASAQPDASVAVLEGATRIAVIIGTVPHLTDGDGDPLLPAWTGPSFRTINEIALSKDGETVAFCADDESGGLDPFAGRVGQVEKLVEHDHLCKNARPGADGRTIVFVEYGEGIEPHNRFRFVDLQGQPEPGDRGGGATQVWSPFFVDEGSAVYAVFSSSSDVGPIHRFDRQTGSSERSSEGELRAPIRLSGDGRAVGSYGSRLRIADLETGVTEDVFTFPSSPPDCSYDGGESDPLCFLGVLQPSWHPSGRVLAFAGVGTPGLTDDTEGDIFLYDLDDESLTRVTNDDVHERRPFFGADGEWLYWMREGGELVRALADGSGSPETLAQDLGSPYDVIWL